MYVLKIVLSQCCVQRQDWKDIIAVRDNGGPNSGHDSENGEEEMESRDI